MSKRIFSALMMFLLVLGTLALAFNVLLVKASGNIYINADGSISPSTAPIYSADDIIYTLTGNITSDADGIVIERDNIVLDGAGYTVMGNGSGDGIYLVYRNNVTIKNTEITTFDYGIELSSSSNNTISGNNVTAINSEGIALVSSSNNSVSGNEVTANNYYGIGLESSSNNSVSGNEVTTNNGSSIILHYSVNNSVSGNNVANNGGGIVLGYSFNNSVSGNNVTANKSYGIVVGYSSNNTLSGNNVTANIYGISLASSSNNFIFHNNFVDNTVQVYSTGDSANVWDNGCEGNYWSDYNGTDSTNYIVSFGSDVTNNDGIGDTPYAIDANNTDNYPLMNVYWSPCDINHDLKVDMKDIGRAARAFNTAPGDALWNPHSDITGPQYLVPDNKVDTRDFDLIVSHFGKHL